MRRTSWKHWTTTEEAILRAEWPTTTAKRLAWKLGRTAQAVKLRAWGMGMKKNKRERHDRRRLHP